MPDIPASAAALPVLCFPIELNMSGINLLNAAAGNQILFGLANFGPGSDGSRAGLFFCPATGLTLQ